MPALSYDLDAKDADGEGGDMNIHHKINLITTIAILYISAIFLISVVLPNVLAVMLIAPILAMIRAWAVIIKAWEEQ